MTALRVYAQPFMRILLALIAVIGAVAVFRTFVVPEVQDAFRITETEASFLRRGGILLVALAAYWLYVGLIERRAATEIRPTPVGILLGLVSGAALISITTLSLFATGTYELVSVPGASTALFGVAAVILVAAMLEEIVFRGILFRILEGAWGTVPALWLQSLIFAVVHLSNIEGADALTAVTMVTCGTLIGALWTMIFVHTRNLWIVGTHHAAWNFSILLTGLPLSGLNDWRADAPFQSRYSGPDWLTGGIFGPEDSVITLIVVAIALSALLYSARRQNLLQSAGL